MKRSFTSFPSGFRFFCLAAEVAVGRPGGAAAVAAAALVVLAGRFTQTEGGKAVVIVGFRVRMLRMRGSLLVVLLALLPALSVAFEAKCSACKLVAVR